MSTFKKFNTAADVDAKLKSSILVLNQAAHKTSIKEMNKFLADVRRDFKIKLNRSLSSAAQVVLTS